MLLPCPRDVFIVDVYADLTLVIFLDPEVFMMKPVDQANRQHVRDQEVYDLGQLQEGWVRLGEVNELRKVDSNEEINYAAENV